jgi:hypothetical protein
MLRSMDNIALQQDRSSQFRFDSGLGNAEKYDI